MREADGAAALKTGSTQEDQAARRSFTRIFMTGVIAFLTLADLFAAQAILPILTQAYGVTPSAMGLAVNACTLGMALASIAAAFFSQRIERRRGILLSLSLLAIPTSLLAFAPDLLAFTLLRILQGVFMASAFTLTLAYLGEQCSAREAAGAFAAYITGNVASNLFGRLMSAALAAHFGLVSNFLVFAGLNLAGAVIASAVIGRVPPEAHMRQQEKPALKVLSAHLSHGGLRAACAIGFCILFAFIGTFTFVNFVLVRPPLSLGMMAVGFVYFVFAPSILTTPLAGRMAARAGTRPAMWCALGLAAAALPLMLAPRLEFVIAGMIFAGAGTFSAQAIATGFVGRAVMADRAAASGLYLASYFGGGLAGSAVLGFVFDCFGWAACLAGIGFALGAAAWLTLRLSLSPSLAR